MVLKVHNVFVAVALIESVKIMMNIIASYAELESTIFACFTGLDATYTGNNPLLQS
jgi:hypothetical protein